MKKEMLQVDVPPRPDKPTPMYQVRRVHLGKTSQLDALAHECGQLYSQTLVFFWRTVRHKGIWLKAKHLMRLFTNPKLHAHTADACVQAFFAALASWRERRKIDPNTKPPRKRKWYYRIEYKQSAMNLHDGYLRLSNGQGNDPLVLPWPWPLPQTVVIHWTGTQYEAIATYRLIGPAGTQVRPEGEAAVCVEHSAGIDLGEIHPAVSHDGHYSHLMNGRLLRSKRQYCNKLMEHLNKKIASTKKGSRRRKKLVRSKQKQLKKIKYQTRDIEHKLTSRLVSTLHQEGVQTLVIGDVRDIRQNLDVGSKQNQKLHQWSHGTIRHYLTYKALRLGMRVVLQEERYTSRTCPVCGHRRKSSPAGRLFRCTNKHCGWIGHRDGVGAANIRYKYRGEFGFRHVVGAMTPPTGCGYVPHLSVAGGLRLPPETPRR
ncbi:MAG TPA: transposase [Ktedonosporobacter sp.]|nr:transposase [Ktedonosporobacter sp.]